MEYDGGLRVSASALIEAQEIRDIISHPRRIPRKRREEIALIAAEELLGEHEIKDHRGFIEDYGILLNLLVSLRSSERWQRLKEIDDVGWVTAHKLVARKRPHLHPVYDRVVHRWFEEPDGIRYGLAVVLGSDANLRGALEAALPDVAGLHLVRRIDIAIWLLGATNSAAVTVRHRLGVDAPPGRA